MKEKLVVVGVGGFGREVMWQIQQIGNYYILGYVDSNETLINKLINGLPVLGTEDWLLQLKESINVVIAIGSPNVRKSISERLQVNPYIKFPTILADDVRFSSTVTFGRGCIVCSSSVLTVNVTLNEFVILNLDCTVGHDVIISSFVTVHPSVNISGNSTIEKCVEIGTGTSIIQGKRIGESAIIGAGSVVVKDIPAYCTAVGTPAMPIKFTNGI